MSNNCKPSNFLMYITMCFLAAMGTTTLAHDGHPHPPTIPDDHVVVGRDLGDNLGWAISTVVNPLVVAESTNPAFPGWFDDPLGLLQVIETTSGFYTLEPGHSVGIQITAVDPGLKLYDSFLNRLEVGDSWFVFNGPATSYAHGADNQHFHPQVHIDRTVLPDYDGTPLNFEFRFVDLNVNGYTPSNPFSVSVVPEPVSVALLGAGALLLRRRRK